MGISSKRGQAWFAQRLTHDRHAIGVRYPAAVRSQVRAAGTHFGADAGPVRSGGSRIWFATLMARTSWLQWSSISPAHEEHADVGF